MFYLIHKKSGKVIGQSEGKSTLRRQQKALKNPSAHSISKFKTLNESKANRGRPATKKQTKTKKGKKVKNNGNDKQAKLARKERRLKNKKKRNRA